MAGASIAEIEKYPLNDDIDRLLRRLTAKTAKSSRCARPSATVAAHDPGHYNARL
jgi:hypothetical protein